MHITLSVRDLYLYVLISATIGAGIWALAPWSASLQDPTTPPLHTSLAAVPVTPHRGDVAGYKRQNFGGWGSIAGCPTRDWVIASQTGHTHHPCTAPEAPLHDPYTNESVQVADVEVDHIYPLAAAWDNGASTWDHATLREFANDPRNLVAVEGEINQEKSDHLPGEWLPPHRGSRCWYSRRVAELAATYGLSLSHADVSTMRRQCRLEFLRRPLSNL